jgi:hypothetical protein
MRPPKIALLSSLLLGCGGASGDTTSGIGISLSGAEAGESTESGDSGEVSSPACEALIDCVREVTPEVLSETIGAYGPEGSCFDTPGVTLEDCEVECDALRADLALLNPDVAECAPLGCGDGVLALDELCDSISACTATCRFVSTVHRCNMINQLGCEDDEFCWLFSDGTEMGCYSAFVANNGHFVGDECDTIFGPCEDLSFCAYQSPACSGPLCCRPRCYIGATENDFGACPDGGECVPIGENFGPSLVIGAEFYGYCN